MTDINNLEIVPQLEFNLLDDVSNLVSTVNFNEKTYIAAIKLDIDCTAEEMRIAIMENEKSLKAMIENESK